MEEKRGFWESRFVFVMAVIGSAVGLGNVWRFPYVCYANGGGAFLIPFLLALFTAGVPLLILEFGIGFKTQKSAPMALAEISQKYEWLGWFAVIVGLMVMTYYGVVMGWCFNYLYHAFSVAWGAEPKSFFYDGVLQLSGGIGDIGGIVPAVFLGLFLCWFFVFFCIYKGVETVSKVVLLTVPLPVIILIILAIRGLTLDGAMDGLRYFLTPDFEALRNPQVWLAAYGQVFFSLSLGFGVMIAYASFLPKKSDINNNAFMASFADAGISFLGGIAVFSTLGYLALQEGKPVQDVIASGPGLTFVTYPTIINLLPFGAKIFGVLFFIMLLTLGIDSAFSLVEAGVAGAIDKWKLPRLITNASISILAFVIGILYSTNAGLYWLDIIDNYMTKYGLTFVGLAECIVIGYIFGTEKIREHVNLTSDIKIGKWWDFCIKIVTPVVLIYMFISAALGDLSSAYSGYPAWAQFSGGWGLIILLIGAAVALSSKQAGLVRLSIFGAAATAFCAITAIIKNGFAIKIPANVLSGIEKALATLNPPSTASNIAAQGTGLPASAKVMLALFVVVLLGGFLVSMAIAIKADKKSKAAE